VSTWRFRKYAGTKQNDADNGNDKKVAERSKFFTHKFHLLINLVSDANGGRLSSKNAHE
jgi:hypothetical protein